MRVLIFNQSWFADELRSAGHEVMVVGFGRDFPVRFDYSALHIDTILKKLPQEFEPDVILLHDESSPWFVAGLDETSVPVVFYSVDTHHHYALHRYLAHTADHTFIAQPDYAEHFSSIGENPAWLPLWASRAVEPTEERIASVCFVGNLNRNLNPSRVDFFEALQKKVEVLIAHGAFWEYFPKSEIVINQTVKGDLNFRVFEALMCGTVLLTEASGNGLFDLFKDGEHLVSYRKGDVDHAVARIEEILSDKTRARRIARQGRDEIMAKHLPIHRAQTIDAVLRGLTRRPKLLRHMGAFVNFSALGASAFEVDRRLSSQALVHGLKAGRKALERAEPMTVELACHAIRSAYLYDLIFGSRAGEEFVRDCSEAHPELPVLALARVRALLNRGDHNEAQAWVRDHFGVEEKRVFETAERVVTQILSNSVAPNT
jgi:glycosyltransferase involved in cell wall biosynthesis